MNRLLRVTVFLLAILFVRASAETTTYEFPEMNAVLELESDWVCVTFDSEIPDLTGSVYHIEAFYQMLEQAQSIIRSQPLGNTRAYLYFWDGEMLLECQLLRMKTEESESLWDFALVGAQEITGSSEMIETYESTSGDLFVGMDMTSQAKDQCDKYLVYATVNNGLLISVNILSAYPSEDSALLNKAHSLLNSISFTSKAPKPSAKTTAQVTTQTVSNGNAENTQGVYLTTGELVILCAVIITLTLLCVANFRGKRIRGSFPHVALSVVSGLLLAYVIPVGSVISNLMSDGGFKTYAEHQRFLWIQSFAPSILPFVCMAVAYWVLRIVFTRKK